MIRAAASTLSIVVMALIVSHSGVEARGRCNQGWKHPVSGSNFCVPSHPSDYATWKECKSEVESWSMAGFIQGMAGKEYLYYCTLAKSKTGLLK